MKGTIEEVRAEVIARINDPHRPLAVDDVIRSRFCSRSPSIRRDLQRLVLWRRKEVPIAILHTRRTLEYAFNAANLQTDASLDGVSEVFEGMAQKASAAKKALDELLRK